MPPVLRHWDVAKAFYGVVNEVLGRVAFGGGFIEYRLRWSKRKTLAITVRPDASVMVTAARDADLEAVAAKVRKRTVWIRRQQEYFSRFLPKLPPRRYVSGETHRYLGRQYRLRVAEGPGENAKLRGKFIEVETARKGDRGQVRRLIDGWYVLHARLRFARSLALPSHRKQSNLSFCAYFMAGLGGLSYMT